MATFELQAPDGRMFQVDAADMAAAAAALSSLSPPARATFDERFTGEPAAPPALWGPEAARRRISAACRRCRIVRQLARLMKRAVEGFTGGAGEHPLGISLENRAKYPALQSLQLLAAPIDLALRLPGGSMAAPRDWARARRAFIGRRNADRLQRDLDIIGKGVGHSRCAGRAAAGARPYAAVYGTRRAATEPLGGLPAPTAASACRLRWKRSRRRWSGL